MNQRRSIGRSEVLILGFMFVVGTYFLLPVLWLTMSATKSTSDLFGTFGLGLGHTIQPIENLRTLFAYDHGLFVRWLLNTVLYAGVGAFFGTLLASMAGYALAKYTFRGRELIFNVVLGGVLVPGTALALPLYLLLSKVNLTDTYWSVLLPSLVSPFGVYLSRVYAEASVPDELLDAARVEGAGEARVFFSVALRVMSPALVTIFLFQFVAIWNNFFLPLVMLSNQRLYPVTLGLYTLNTQTAQAPELFSVVITGALVSVVPLIIAFVSLQRFWQTGLTQGAVK